MGRSPRLLVVQMVGLGGLKRYNLKLFKWFDVGSRPEAVQPTNLKPLADWTGSNNTSWFVSKAFRALPVAVANVLCMTSDSLDFELFSIASAQYEIHISQARPLYPMFQGETFDAVVTYRGIRTIFSCTVITRLARDLLTQPCQHFDRVQGTSILPLVKQGARQTTETTSPNL